jgi:hypothetical protein
LTTGRWSHPTVRRLLANPRYRGRWAYGDTENVWQSKKDYARQVRRAEPLKEVQFEELRIIDDATWHEAQRRLREVDRTAAGRKPRDGRRASRPRLLNGLFVCAAHDRPLYVGGGHGTVMFCKECRGLPADRRPLYSLLNRVLALRCTCEALAKLIRGDEELVAQVIAAFRAEVAALQAADPSRLHSLRSRLQALGDRIRFVMDNLGESDLDRREAKDKLHQLRRERAEVQAQLGALESAAERTLAPPDDARVRELIARRGEVLAAAARGGVADADAAEARRVVEALTGGRIELVQRGEPGARRGWLQGRFRPRLIAGLVGMLEGPAPQAHVDEPLVTIDYREPTPTECQAERVKELFDRGLLIKAIAAELGITRNMASKALDHWYASRGLERPDGRARRAALEVKHLEPPPFVRIADAAMRLYDEGLPLRDIASRVGCDRATLSKAIGQWHAARGLTAPDGRHRRKQLGRAPAAGARPAAESA